MARRGRPLGRPRGLSQGKQDEDRLVRLVGYDAAAAVLGIARGTLEKERVDPARQPTPNRGATAGRWLARPAAVTALRQLLGLEPAGTLGTLAASGGTAEHRRQPGTTFFASAAAIVTLAGAKPWATSPKRLAIVMVDPDGMHMLPHDPEDLDLLRLALRAALRKGARLRHIVDLRPYATGGAAAVCDDIIHYLACGDYDLRIATTAEAAGEVRAMALPFHAVGARGFASVLGPAGTSEVAPAMLADSSLTDWLAARYEALANALSQPGLDRYDMSRPEDILHWEQDLLHDEQLVGERLLWKSEGPSAIHIDPDLLADAARAPAGALGAQILQLRRDRQRLLRNQAARGHPVRELSTWNALQRFAATGALPPDIARRTWFTRANTLGAAEAQSVLRGLDGFLTTHRAYRMKWIRAQGACQDLFFEVKRPPRGDGVLYLETWPASRQGPRQVNFRCSRQEIVDAFAAKFEELWSSEPDSAENSGRGALHQVLA